MEQHPARRIYNLYFRFRGVAGLGPDTSPADNVWLSDTGKPSIPHKWIKYDAQDPTKNKFIPEQIEATFRYDKCASDDEIKKALKAFQGKILSDTARHWSSLNWIVDTKGKKRDWQKINQVLENCLDAYRIGRPLSAIVAALHLAETNANDKKLKSADREAKRMLTHAGNLIEAAKEGFTQFCREAMKPLPRNL